jgi:hypothetical protein
VLLERETSANLLWSEFPEASAAQLVYSVRFGTSGRRGRSIVPPLLNVEAVYHTLKTVIKK